MACGGIPAGYEDETDDYLDDEFQFNYYGKLFKAKKKKSPEYTINDRLELLILTRDVKKIILSGIIKMFNKKNEFHVDIFDNQHSRYSTIQILGKSEHRRDEVHNYVSNRGFWVKKLDFINCSNCYAPPSQHRSYDGN